MFADDDKMVALGVDYLRVMSIDYLLVPFLFCLNGLNIGSGHTKFSLINNCMSALLFRIPFSYFFGMILDWKLPGVGLGAPTATVAALIVAIWFYFTGRWQTQVVFADKEN